MPTYIDSTCPSCQRKLRVRTKYLGRQICCNYCYQTFLALGADDPTPVGAIEAEATRRRVSEQEAEIEGLRAELASRTAESDAANQQINQARSNLDELRGQVRDLQEQRLQDRETIRRDTELRAELQKARSEIETLQARAVALQGRADEAVRLEGELRASEATARDLQEARADRERLELERADANRLIEQVQAESVRALAEAAANHQAAYAGLVRTLEAERVEADEGRARERAELDRERQAALGQIDDLRRDRDQLAARVVELEEAARAEARLHELETARLAEEREETRRHADGVERQNVELDAQVRGLRAGLDQERRDREAEQTAQRARWIEADRRRDVEEARAEAKRLAWQGRLIAARNQFDRDRESLSAEVARLRREADAALREREAESREVVALQLDRDRLATLLEWAEKVRLDADRDHHDLSGQLAEALERARRQDEAASRRIGELTGQVRELQAELARERAVSLREPRRPALADPLPAPMLTIETSGFEVVTTTPLPETHQCLDCRAIFPPERVLAMTQLGTTSIPDRCPKCGHTGCLLPSFLIAAAERKRTHVRPTRAKGHRTSGL